MSLQSARAFADARAFLLSHRDDYEAAYRGFRWPQLDVFNWALDWFDHYAKGNTQAALTIATAPGNSTSLSFDELSNRSSRVANFLTAQQIRRGDRVLVMLGNVQELWEVMLACQKIGAVIVPTTTQAAADDLVDRIVRGKITLIVTEEKYADTVASVPAAQGLKRMLVGGRRSGWLSFDDARSERVWAPKGITKATDPLLLYFTSGTTSKPKLVVHTHQSYPVGHLSTMYWLGVREGTTHQNISSPGWAKHAWSSMFAPWNAGATVFMHDYLRFNAAEALQLLEEHSVHSLCAPPTVWRLLILNELGKKPRDLAELASAGEPLNPEVIEKVQDQWGVTIRDGYGQTETTAQIGNSPGAPLKIGSMGRPLPGYRIVLLDADGKEAESGEVALRLGQERPSALMEGYLDDSERTSVVMSNGYYRTGDEAARDDSGYFHFVGRGDDVFKSSDYRISPFELESVLLEHHAVAESAVIPSPDPVRLCVPKAVVVLKPEYRPNAEIAEEILQFVKGKVPPYKQIRRLEFSTLPKTVSGKIRRSQLREEEKIRREKNAPRAPHEYWSDDFKK